MKIQKAFKFEIMPTGEHSRKIRQFCGCSRFVYNRALGWQNEQYKADNTFKFRYSKIANLLPLWKQELPWLKECHSQVLQQSLKDLEKSFRNFFAGRANFPKFKRKGLKESIRFPQGFKVDQQNSRLYLPKIGWIRYRNSRRIIGTIKNITVSIKCGKYFVAVQSEYDREQRYPDGGEIGIDMGIVRFATLSTGDYFAPLNAFKRLKERIAVLQKQLKNKVKFSRNWQKLKSRIAKLHHQIANQRKDYLHKISAYISKNHAIVYVEDLQVSNMSKSAKGTAEKHGKNIRQKSGLNRAIFDQSWYEFRRQLDYKLGWKGGFLVPVPPQNTSRICPECGHTGKENRQTQEKFECSCCGFLENADVVGAVNIFRRGKTLFTENRKKSGADSPVALVK